jgi:hypothetical protein
MYLSNTSLTLISIQLHVSACGGGLMISFIFNFDFMYLVSNVNKIVPSSGG